MSLFCEKEVNASTKVILFNYPYKKYKMLSLSSVVTS